MAARGEGYGFGTYLLFGVDDALHLSGDQTVEAIVLGTPYERLRYQAYLLAHQQLPFTPEAIAAFDAAHGGELDVVIFAHSRSSDDRTFMQDFGAAALDGANGVHLAAIGVERTEPILDVYYTADGAAVMRWLGQVTFRFDLGSGGAPNPDAPLRFSFRDDRGEQHGVTFTPSRYR